MNATVITALRRQSARVKHRKKEGPIFQFFASCHLLVAPLHPIHYTAEERTLCLEQEERTPFLEQDRFQETDPPIVDEIGSS